MKNCNDKNFKVLITATLSIHHCSANKAEAQIYVCPYLAILTVCQLCTLNNPTVKQALYEYMFYRQTIRKNYQTKLYGRTIRRNIKTNYQTQIPVPVPILISIQIQIPVNPDPNPWPNPNGMEEWIKKWRAVNSHLGSQSVSRSVRIYHQNYRCYCI